MNKTEVKKKQMIAVCEMINLLNLWILHGIIGDRGVLYFAVAWLPLGLLSIVAADNVPDALSHMLRGRNTKGHSRSIGAIFQSVLIQQIIIGVIGSVLLLVFSQILAQKVFLFEHTTLAMRILAPTFFLRCILTVLLGRFQGEGSDSPTLMIGFLRPLFTLGFGILFANILQTHGEKVSALLRNDDFTIMYGVAGYSIGIPLAELLLVILLFLILLGLRHHTRFDSHGVKTVDSRFTTMRTLYASMGSSLLLKLLMSAPILISVLLIPRIGEASDEIGTLFGKYLVICGWCFFIGQIIILPICAKICAYQRRQETQLAGEVLGVGIHISAVHFFFSFCIFTFLAVPIGQTMGKASSDLLISMLSFGMATVFFGGMSLLFAKHLRLIDKHLLVSLAYLCANVVFLLSALLFFRILSHGAMALVYAGVVGSAVCCAIVLFLSIHELRPYVEPIRMFGYPAIFAIVSSLIAMLLSKVFMKIVGGFLTIILSLMIAIFLFWAGLLLSRSFTEEEWSRIPGGRFISSVGHLLRLH